MKPFLKIFLMAVAYLAIFILGASSGAIHPACYAYAGAVLALLAELIRYLLGYETRKGVRWSSVPLAFSFFAYSAHWWTDTEGSLAAAVEEMRPGYDQMMIPVIENIPALVVALVLTVPVAMLGIRLAELALKRQAATFR